MNGFEAPEGHRQRRVHMRLFCGAGLHVDAAGDVDGHHRSGDVREHLGGVRPQRARTRDANDTVDHQIGCGRDALHDRTASAGERGQGRLVGTVGVEQHRGGGRTPTTQEGGRPQRVATVVA
jgi:hypothetical protein